MKTDFESKRKSARAKLRKFPYPYEAAFTILSDRHGIHDTEQFLAFHRFLNTSQGTPHGPGLDLEIGDTFWFYDDEEKFSYFKGYSQSPSDQASLIKEYLTSGYIDCMHTYGDFTNHPFERKYAEWAVEEMDRQNFGSVIWVNHGNRSNIQNLNRGVAYHQGADEKSVAYHMDLTRGAGFKFFWRHLTPFNGQDRPLTTAEYCSTAKFESPSKLDFVARRAVKYALAAMDGLLGSPFGFYDRYADNHLLQPAQFDDGSRILEFKRFNIHPEGIWKGARVIDLLHQLQPEVIDRLVLGRGYMIVYNHLEYGDFFAPDVVDLLRKLSARFHTGEVWVTTSYRMLRYNYLHHLLSWDENLDSEGNLSITIAKEINHPIMGRERLSAHDLEGFSFLIPNKYTPHFRIGEKEVPCTCFSKGTTESVFGLPINRLPFPDA